MALKKKKNWIPKDLVKGGLHKMLGISTGKKIPVSTLKAAAKKPGLLGKRARFALTVGKF